MTILHIPAMKEELTNKNVWLFASTRKIKCQTSDGGRPLHRIIYCDKIPKWRQPRTNDPGVQITCCPFPTTILYGGGLSPTM